MILNRSKYVHLLIMFVLAFGISVLPPFGQVTVFGMKSLGVFIAVLYGWIAFDLFWTSIFGFLLMPILGLNSVAGAFAAGIGNQMVINVMLTMAFSVAIDMAGVTDVMTSWLLQRKIINKSPWALVIGILAIAAILGGIGVGIAAIFLLWSITLKIAEYCDIKKGDPLLSFLIMMITVFTMTTSYIFPFRGGSLIFMAPLLQVTDTPIPMGSYIAWSTVFLLVFYVLIVLTAKFILKVNVSKFVLPEDLLREMHEKQINAKEKMAVAVLFAYVLVLVVPAIFTSMPGAAFINKLGVGGISGIAILLLAALRYEGKGLVDLVKVFSKVDWTLFFLVAVTYPIADLIKHADSGIMPTIMGFIMPIVSGMGALTFLIVSMIALGLVTQVTHNIVLAAMFEPFLLPIYAQLGGNMYTMWFILTFTLNMAYCTPAGSFQAALVFGHEQMEKKHAYTYGIMLLVLIWIVSIVCGLPLGNALFGSLI